MKNEGLWILLHGTVYLKKYFSVNKVKEDFDFGAILCTREMIKIKNTGKIPDAKWLSEKFPQFREMQMKANGTYDKKSFKC
ncbi:hypothetical protein CAEBREN_15590 [Caenorhabditis brenneri]|uniref:Uncharacterized protein n=1 Tax=Caenorhabditis brenneri TaxID=135651 RepID=G0MEY5_CAEBE|nr:hypothetical protein CAEBREN_15590 [Caenorhabditis brenneri]